MDMPEYLLPKVAALACGMAGTVEFCKLYRMVPRYPATDLTGAPHVLFTFGLMISNRRFQVATGNNIGPTITSFVLIAQVSDLVEIFITFKLT